LKLLTARELIACLLACLLACNWRASMQTRRQHVLMSVSGSAARTVYTLNFHEHLIIAPAPTYIFCSSSFQFPVTVRRLSALHAPVNIQQRRVAGSKLTATHNKIEWLIGCLQRRCKTNLLSLFQYFLWSRAIVGTSLTVLRGNTDSLKILSTSCWPFEVSSCCNHASRLVCFVRLCRSLCVSTVSRFLIVVDLSFSWLIRPCAPRAPVDLIELKQLACSICKCRTDQTDL